MLKLTLGAAIFIISTSLTGCNGEEIVRKSFEAEHAAQPGAPTGQSPVPLNRLTIPPSDLAPTETPRIDPDPILPTMDEVYRTRRVPNARGDLLEWKKPSMPSTQSHKEYKVTEKGSDR